LQHHSGDLEAAEAACAELMVGEDKDNTPSAVPKLSSQAKGKRGHDDDQFLQSLQMRVSSKFSCSLSPSQPP